MKRIIGLHVFICLDGSSLAGLAPSWVLRAASSLGALASLACVLPLGASSLEQVQLASFLAGVGPSLASLVVHPCEGLASCQAVGDQGCWEAVGSWLLQEVVLRMVSVEFSLAEMQPLHWGGKKKEKKRERIPEEKTVTKQRKLLRQRSFSRQAFRIYLTWCCTLICSYSGTNPWFTLLVKMEAPDIPEDSYYSNYSS